MEISGASTPRLVLDPTGSLPSPVTALPRAENAMALDSATTSPKSPERSSLNCKRQTSLCASLRPFSFRLSDASINCESNPRQIVRCCSALPSRHPIPGRYYDLC